MYKVIKGIFEGYVFKGKEIKIAGQKRIWDSNTTGRSYPKENCIEIKKCIMSNIKVGDKVICVDDKNYFGETEWFQQWVEYGKEYTIRDVFYTSPRKGNAVLLEEVHNAPIFVPYLGREKEPSFGIWRFEKVIGQVNQKEKENKLKAA